MTGTRSDPDTEGFGKVLDTGDNFNYISCAQFDALAIDEGDILWVWGDNTNGALGDGTENYIAEPMKLMDNVIWADSEMYGIYALKANGELWGAGRLTGEFDPSYDMEKPPAQEQIRLRRLPHKILDGVLVKSAA